MSRSHDPQLHIAIQSVCQNPAIGLSMGIISTDTGHNTLIILYNYTYRKCEEQQPTDRKDRDTAWRHCGVMGKKKLFHYNR